MKLIFTHCRNILWLYRPYLKYAKPFVFLSLLFWLGIIPAAQMVTILLPSTIVNMLQENRPFSHIVLCVIAMQLMLLFQPMYEDAFNLLCKNRMLPYMDAKLKKDVYEKALKTDYRYIDDPEYYDNYTWAVMQYSAKARDAQELVNRMSSSVLIIISMLTVIAVLRPLAVAVTIFGTILENIMYIVTNYHDVKMEEELLPYDRRLEYCHKVFYSPSHAADLKSTYLKTYLFQTYDKAQADKLATIQKYGRKMLPWAWGGDLTFYVARTFVILNIAYGIHRGDIPTVATYITMMAAVEALKNAMNEMFYHVKDANRLGMYARRIRAFFDIPSSIEADMGQKSLPPEGPYEVEFRNIRFRYPHSGFQITDFSLKIDAGEKIAIVGENGVGKSTLVKLLMRFYDPEDGGIYINGKNIRGYDIHRLRRKIGVAFQNSNVYAMSFAENICLYGPVDPEKLPQIIKRAGLEKVLEKNHGDTATELTKEFHEDGIMLSGGEMQKVAIARLLGSEFGLLLFDEPSSALDPLAEYEMAKLILHSSNLATTIIVAHRLSTIRNADRIVLVDKGKIAEMGTHDELMLLKGKYYEMFTKQAENYKQ